MRGSREQVAEYAKTHTVKELAAYFGIEEASMRQYVFEHHIEYKRARKHSAYGNEMYKKRHLAVKYLLNYFSVNDVADIFKYPVTVVQEIQKEDINQGE